MIGLHLLNWGSVKRNYELYFVFNRNFYPEALNVL